MLRTVVLNSFWIIGLALILAALSYHRYLAIIWKRSLREQLGQASFQLVFLAGAALVGLGLAGTAAALWETIVWAILTAVAILEAIRVWKGSARSKAELHGD